MKQTATIILLLLGLTACGGGNPPSPVSPATPTPPPGSPPPGETSPALTLPFDADQPASLTLYVDAGAASGGDGSQASPYHDLVQALNRASPGTRILIRAGTYPAPGHFSQLQGRADAPIAIVADGQVIIDANHSGSGLTLSDARYVLLEGVTIQNTGIHGLNIDDGGSFATPSSHLILRNIHFRNIGSGNNNDCLKLSGVTDFYISQSEFEGCNRGEAIDMVGCHRGTITGNYFHDVVGSGVQTKGGSADILIHGNEFANIPLRAINAGGHTGEPYFRPIDSAYEAQNIRILANLFRNTGAAAVAFSGCRNCVAANNTIIEPINYVLWFIEENTSKGPGRDIAVLNNIVVFDDSALNDFSAFNSDGLSLSNTFSIDANLWFARDNPGFIQVPNGYALPFGTHNLVQVNPLLDQSMQPAVNSPALGAGLAVPGGVPVDYLGRAYRDPPDLGAFAHGTP